MCGWLMKEIYLSLLCFFFFYCCRCRTRKLLPSLISIPKTAMMINQLRRRSRPQQHLHLQQQQQQQQQAQINPKCRHSAGQHTHTSGREERGEQNRKSDTNTHTVQQADLFWCDVCVLFSSLKAAAGGKPSGDKSLHNPHNDTTQQRCADEME